MPFGFVDFRLYYRPLRLWREGVWRWIRKGCLLLCLTWVIACQQQLKQQEDAVAWSRQRNKAAQYNMQLGLAYLARGEFPRAKQKLLKALKLAPHSPDVNASMAYFLEQTHSQVKAKHYYQTALRLAPHSGAQKNNYGAFLCRTGAYQQGLVLLIQAGEDEHYTHSAMAYENAGRCAHMMGDERKSKIYFQRASAQNPQQQAMRVMATTS